jgi:hypothetical protein
MPVEPLPTHIARVKALPEADLAEGSGEVHLPFALARKDPHAAREWAWQHDPGITLASSGAVLPAAIRIWRRRRAGGGYVAGAGQGIASVIGLCAMRSIGRPSSRRLLLASHLHAASCSPTIESGKRKARTTRIASSLSLLSVEIHRRAPAGLPPLAIDAS